MAPYRKTIDELRVELTEQAKALRLSCQSYDQGETWQAKQLAAIVYILVHDSVSGRSRSLLTQLGLKSGVTVLSSITDLRPASSVNGWNSARGLVTIKTNPIAFAPKLAPSGETYRRLKFHDWYEEEIFHSVYPKKCSRKNLINYLRSQDGGGHVDPVLTDDTYHSWKYFGHPYMSYDGNAVSGPLLNLKTGKVEPIPFGKPILNGERASMRQVAWEVGQMLAELGS